MKFLIIETIQKLGGKNVPISEVVDSFVNGDCDWDPEDIQSLIHDLCRKYDGIRYGTSDNNNVDTVCIIDTKPVPMPPNQNRHIK